MRQISLTVADNMGLRLSRQSIANDGDMNTILFSVTQPERLNLFDCRAEIEMGAKTTFTEVADNQFILPQAFAGMIRLQLVYTRDNGDYVIKTNVINAVVGNSINALDPSRPGVGDILAKLQGLAFTEAIIDYETNEMIFFNLSGEEVERFVLPGGGGVGVPSGGYVDQILAKASDESFDMQWSEIKPIIGKF